MDIALIMRRVKATLIRTVCIQCSRYVTVALIVAGITLGCEREPQNLTITDFQHSSLGKKWSPAEIFPDDANARAIAVAISANNLSEVDRLLSEGIDVNIQGKQGVTPLAWAFLIKNKRAFRHLLERGADPNHRVMTGLPLIDITAGIDDDSEWLELSLANGGDPNIDNGFTGLPYGNQTPIFTALRFRADKNLKLLIRSGARIDHRDYQGSTVLLEAANRGLFDTVYYLLESGADYNIRPIRGHTLAHLVIVVHVRQQFYVDWKIKVIQFLEERGVNFDKELEQISDLDVRKHWQETLDRRRANK